MLRLSTTGVEWQTALSPVGGVTFTEGKADVRAAPGDNSELCERALGRGPGAPQPRLVPGQILALGDRERWRRDRSHSAAIPGERQPVQRPARHRRQRLIVDFDAEGNVVGIDIDHAADKLDLETLEAVGLRLTTARLR